MLGLWFRASGTSEAAPSKGDEAFLLPEAHEAEPHQLLGTALAQHLRVHLLVAQALEGQEGDSLGLWV